VKALFMKILTGYLIVGAFFAFLLEISWSWSLVVTLFTQFDAYSSFAGFGALLLSMFVHLFIDPILVIIFWLPSLLTALSPDQVGIMQIIFPGFYDPLISVEKA
jgi:hypothetical protein